MEADKLRAKGVTVYTLAVGDVRSIGVKDLYDIAGHQDRFIRIDDYSKLAKQFEVIKERECGM